MVEAVKRIGQAPAGRHAEPQHRRASATRSQRIHGGAIGEVLVAKAWNSQLRGIDRQDASRPSRPPHLDFDLWVGPAPMVALPPQPAARHLALVVRLRLRRHRQRRRPRHRRRLLGPRRRRRTRAAIACLGGKYFFDDDQQFPDTQYAVFEYPDDGKPGETKQLIFEQRIWSPYVQEGYENGAAFYGTKGMLIIGHSVGWKLYGPRNKLIAGEDGLGRPGGPPHELPRLRPRRCEGAQRRRHGRPLVGYLGPPRQHRGSRQ